MRFDGFCVNIFRWLLQILSSKFVATRIRNRHESTDETPPETDIYWCEFPRLNADTLEKRGVEIIANPDEKPHKWVFVKLHMFHGHFIFIIAFIAEKFPLSSCSQFWGKSYSIIPQLSDFHFTREMRKLTNASCDDDVL